VLDGNKQVVYARDRNGAVIGRQLLAVSECEKLVCFEVFPASADRLVESFRIFDQRFAEQLGIPPQAGDEYEVANLVADNWWNDSVLEAADDS